MKRFFILLALLVFALSCTRNYDVCVYGGSSASVTAAYSAAQMGKKVIVVSPDERVGGLTTSGLGWTDIGNKQAVFGVAKQFYSPSVTRIDRMWVPFSTSVSSCYLIINEHTFGRVRHEFESSIPPEGTSSIRAC